jgi:dihydroxyacid dehydratase/phosphogluconate dehydratase
LGVGHVAPEAYEGGLIALVREGDSITIDAKKRLIQLNVPAKELVRRERDYGRRPSLAMLLACQQICCLLDHLVGAGEQSCRQEYSNGVKPVALPPGRDRVAT